MFEVQRADDGDSPVHDRSHAGIFTPFVRGFGRDVGRLI